MKHEVPIADKALLTLEEAAAYFNLGIDVAARCLALKHISINELVKREQERRRHEREKVACEFFERT